LLLALFNTLGAIRPPLDEGASSIISTIFTRFGDMISGPFHETSMLWILIPLLFATFFMEFYFGRYKTEELGWNTAYGNSMVLIFVSIDLLRHLYSSHSGFVFDLPLLLVMVVIFVGVLLTMLDFFHILPKKLAFSISSKFPMNFLAIIAVLIIYNPAVKVDWAAIVAVILLMLVLYAFIALIHKITPMAVPEPEMGD
jgi:hypothetical protein